MINPWEYPGFDDEPQPCPVFGCAVPLTQHDLYFARTLEDVHANHPAPDWMKVTRGKRKGQVVR